MADLLEHVRSLPGYREDFEPWEFANWLNATLGTKVNELEGPEEAATKWLKSIGKKE